MAIIEVKVPQLSESVAEATLLVWHKKIGESVTRDENLVDVETDKVVMELPAPLDGVITRIIKGDGSLVVAGEVIAIIDTDASVKVSPMEVAGAVPVVDASIKVAKSSAGVAMPAAAKILSENNLSAVDIGGTGKDGRVTKGDALAAVAGKSVAPVAIVATPSAVKPLLQQVAAPAGPSLGERPEERVPMSRLRARIAERLVQSQSVNAILTTFNEVNMQPVIDLRNKYKDKFEKEHGVKLGFMSFFVKAAVAALKKYPIINASVDGNDIVYHGYFDIGIAVGSPRGLVVPILRNADQMSIAEIEKKIGEFGAKAKDGKLTLEDLTGGTFSISNGGTFDTGALLLWRCMRVVARAADPFHFLLAGGLTVQIGLYARRQPGRGHRTRAHHGIAAAVRLVRRLGPAREPGGGSGCCTASAPSTAHAEASRAPALVGRPPHEDPHRRRRHRRARVPGHRGGRGARPPDRMRRWCSSARAAVSRRRPCPRPASRSASPGRGFPRRAGGVARVGVQQPGGLLQALDRPHENPDVVLGTGGYVSAPVTLWEWEPLPHSESPPLPGAPRRRSSCSRCSGRDAASAPVRRRSGRDRGFD